MMKAQTKPFALCIDNNDYKASLIAGKVYRILPDPRAAKDDLVRIVHESGEDYVYHKSYFVFVDSPIPRGAVIDSLHDDPEYPKLVRLVREGLCVAFVGSGPSTSKALY